MARLSWILMAGVITAAASPMGCFFVGDDGPDNGNGGHQGYGSQSTTGSSGSTSSGATASDQCNPVTNAGCASDGSSCDLSSQNHTFACFPPPNTVDVCGACDVANGPFCGAGLTCIVQGDSTAGSCFRYCCADSDCGQGGTCDTTFGATALVPSIPSDKVGLCVSAPQTPACGVASPQSGGSCVGGFSASSGSSSSGGGHTTSSSSGAPGSSSSSSGSGATGSSSSGSGASGSSSSGAGGSASGDGGVPPAGDGGVATSSSSSSGGAGGSATTTSSSGGGAQSFDGGHAGRGDAG